jgi:ApbE superfamily uncharacterized protein (UPF0280 family)
MARLPGGRLHFQHGPIDLILMAEGTREAVEAAYARAWRRFETALDELVAELPLLRIPLGEQPPDLNGPIARRMLAACWPYRDSYITPMAAVAGAVAEEILGVMIASPLRRAMVNNGGDIAFFLAPGEKITLGVADNPQLPAMAGTVTIRGGDPSRGVATSGWRGRSQSLGIADAATVLARSAAGADAAATMIANAVNADHPMVSRAPASLVKDDSDLGNLLVTVDVGALPEDVVAEALGQGEREARSLLKRGLIDGAVLLLQGQSRVIGAEMLISARELVSCP